MTKALYFIVLISSFSYAITCTELFFALETSANFDANGKILQDSSYYKQINNDDVYEKSEKLFWSYGQLDSSYSYFHYEDNPIQIQKYHAYTSVDELTKKNNETVFEKSIFGDTTSYDVKRYNNGSLYSTEKRTMTKDYYENVIWHDIISRQKFNLFYSGDTLIKKNIYKYGTNQAQTEFLFIIPNSKNALQCKEYKSISSKFSEAQFESMLEVSITKDGYKLESTNEIIQRIFFFVDNSKNENTTSLQRRVKMSRISSKKNLYDLLGRRR